MTNPATGEVIEAFPTASDANIRGAMAGAHRAFESWSKVSVGGRAEILGRASALFLSRQGELAGIITLEMGKRRAESEGEVQLAADIFGYYAQNAERLLHDEPLETQTGLALIQRRPIGTILGIMPWNYPYYQVARFVAPNLALGNTLIVKHAPNCPRSSAAVARLLSDAGLPADVYTNAYASHEQVAMMLADSRVRGVSLTGSERAGAAVAAEAGRNLKPVVLELGGSDPMIILDASDLDRVVDTAVEARMENTGQACNAPKRMIVMSDLYDEFLDALVTRMSAFVAGDPSDPATSLGPVSSADAVERLSAQIDRAVEQGAKLLLGGAPLDRHGSYFAPTVLTDVTDQMDAYHEELFGPVVMVFRAQDEQDAVRLANDSPYGLGSCVFSASQERARRVGDQIDAGMVFINTPGDSQPDLPFGGVKRSGYGRELGALGIDGFVNQRIVKL